MGQQDGGADPLVSPARGVGAVYAGQDGHTQFFQFRMTEEGGTVSPSVGIHFVLFGQFYTAAVYDPDQWDMQPFGHIRDAKLIVRLSGDPGAGHDFVVETDDNGPFAVDFGQSVNDSGRALFVELRIIDCVKRAPGARVDEVFDTFPNVQLATFFKNFFREACVFDGFNRLGQLLLYPLNAFNVFLGGFHLFVGKRLAERGHFFKIRFHCSSVYTRLPVRFSNAQLIQGNDHLTDIGRPFYQLVGGGVSVITCYRVFR